MMADLDDIGVRYWRVLAAIEREAMLADDTPPWLVGLLGAVDPIQLAELVGDQCPKCGHSVRADLVGEFVEGARALSRGDRRLVEEIRTIG